MVNYQTQAKLRNEANKSFVINGSHICFAPTPRLKTARWNAVGIGRANSLQEPSAAELSYRYVLKPRTGHRRLEMREGLRSQPPADVGSAKRRAWRGYNEQY